MTTPSGIELFGRRIEPIADASDRPVAPALSRTLFVSDAVADALAALETHFVALRPGADFSALHDSIVNHRGNHLPQLLACFDHGQALDMAYGYALALDSPMVVGLADGRDPARRVRLFSENQLPLIALATDDPRDPERRQSFKATFRANFADDIHRVVTEACWASTAEPPGPVLVVLPKALMERALDEVQLARGPRLRSPQTLGGLGSGQHADLAAILDEVNAPLILAGRVGRSANDWARLRTFAETYGSQVVTAFGNRAAFDPEHPLHVGQIGGPGNDAALRAYRDADVVVALKWSEWKALDAAHTGRRRNFLIAVGLDWVKGRRRDDYGAPDGDLPDLVVQATPSNFLRDIRDMSGFDDYPVGHEDVAFEPRPAERGDSTLIGVGNLMAALQWATRDAPTTLAHLPADWCGPAWRARGPLDALGSSEMPGLGCCIGAALAFQDQARLVVGLIDATDLPAQAAHLWTASHFNLPLLIVVLHQGGVPGARRRQTIIADERGRERRNASVATGFIAPAVDVAALASAFGAACLPKATTTDDLARLVAEGVQQARRGGAVLMEVDLNAQEEGEHAERNE